MDGPEFVKWIETTLIQNDIPKEVFYAESGISTANMSQWRSGEFKPSSKSIAKAEAFFEKYAKKEKPATLLSDELHSTNYDLLNAENKALIDEMIAKLLKSQSGE